MADSKIVPGRKRRKAGGGTFEEVRRKRSVSGYTDTRPKLARVPKGRFRKNPSLIQDRHFDIKQRPIAKKAINLLKDFLKRSAFWQACRQVQAPPEWAGDLLLGGIGKSRSYAVLQELDEADGPLAWFRQKYEESVGDGSMDRGRDTERSQMADTFFLALLGFDPRPHQDLCGMTRFDAEVFRSGKEFYEVQAMDYHIYAAVRGEKHE